MKLILLALAILPAAAFAQPNLDPLSDPGGFAELIHKTVVDKNWWLLSAIILIGLVSAGRKWGGSKWPFLKSKLGGLALNFVGAFATAAAIPMLAGVVGSTELLLAAAKAGIMAAGGWSIIKTVKEYLAETKAAKAGADAAKNPTDALNR